jgi:hypothetical protein
MRRISRQSKIAGESVGKRGHHMIAPGERLGGSTKSVSFAVLSAQMLALPAAFRSAVAA